MAATQNLVPRSAVSHGTVMSMQGDFLAITPSTSVQDISIISPYAHQLHDRFAGPSSVD